MVSAAQNAASIKTASRNVAARLGVDPANLSYDERTRYNKALAAEILRYPQSFTDATLATARVVADREYSAIEDASFDWSAFVDAAADQASITLPSVGNKLLLGAVLVAAVFFGVKAWSSK